MKMNEQLKAMAASHPTPYYLYDMKLLRRTIAEAKAAAANPAFEIHYAVKANSEPEILRVMAEAGMGADTVSGNEVALALECGFSAEKIVFAGVGKSDAEITAALEAGIGCFNVESLEELEVMASIAGKIGRVAPVALRINPDIDAHTHHYITTGLAENKFGIDMSLLDKALAAVTGDPRLKLRGLHFHIGSQITAMEPYRILCERINKIQEECAAKSIVFESINVGGGLGIDYDDPDTCPVPDFKEYFDTIDRNLHIAPGQTVHFELGRSLVAQCGSLITKVLYVKHGVGKRFVIVDAGMSDLIRPALYGAHHKIENITAAAGATEETYDVVGPICESSDVFGENELLPATRRGDILAIRSAGAYGRVMAMRYNCRTLPEAVFAD